MRAFNPIDVQDRDPIKKTIMQLTSINGADVEYYPRRHAILLIGGDKTGQWQRWYDEYIPIADELYDTYLEELREEGLI